MLVNLTGEQMYQFGVALELLKYLYFSDPHVDDEGFLAVLESIRLAFDAARKGA